MASDGGSVGRSAGNRAASGSFEWVTSSPTPAEVAVLEAHFPEIVQLPVEEMDVESRGWQQRAVLMRTFRRWVPVEAFLREFRRGGISGEILPISLAFRSFIFRFADAETRDLVMERPWVINGQPVAVEAWRPDFVPASDAISSALVWIRMPNLPIEFWREDFIRDIVSPAEQFHSIDTATVAKSRGGYARACARVDLRSPLRPGTRVRGAISTFWQPFVYEQMDGICSSCGTLHLLGSCSPPARQAAEASAETPLFGTWMSAVRQRKAGKGPQADDSRKKKTEGNPDSSVPRASSPVRNAVPGKQADGWEVQSKVARRRRNKGPFVDSMVSLQSGSSTISQVNMAKADGVAGSRPKEARRASGNGNVPVSGISEGSETFPSQMQISNPFAALNVDLDDDSHLRQQIRN